VSLRLPHTLRVLASLTCAPITGLLAQGAAEPVACDGAPRAVSFPRDSAPDLVGLWDFTVDMRTTKSTGVMALGRIDDGYAGALTPDATTTVVIRRLTLRRDSVHMAVASAESDVLFDGRLVGTGDSMCGIVTYHQGARFAMTATKGARARR
jgi:hypothetical protein